MTGTTFVLLSGALTYGVPVAFAIRELILLRRSRPDRNDPPPEPRFTRAPGPLPECLLPPRPMAKVRVLEEV